MNIWFVIIEIIIIFTVCCYSEKITFYNLSPYRRVNKTTINKEKFKFHDETIPIKIIGETSDLLENQVIVGKGQKYNNYTLVNDKTYLFSKINQMECKDVPFYYDEETGLDFYFDNCHISTYMCDDGITEISTDTTYYIENESEQVKIACSQVMPHNANKLQKRAECDTFNSYFNAFLGLASGLSALIFTGPVVYVAYTALVVNTAISMVSTLGCTVGTPSKDNCCKVDTSCNFGPNGLGACYTDYDCIDIW